MELAVGARVRARGLVWDVADISPLGAQSLLHLRCASGDLAGLAWDMLHPAELVEPLRDALRPEAPGRLSGWWLHHAACLLDQLPNTDQLLATEPGRIRIEPYQLVPLMRALELLRPRLLLADGVGLGKTIEAGLIAVELIARRRAHRILVVAPAGALLTQWEQELRLRFGLRFTRIADAAALHDERRRLELGGNPFAAVSLCLTSLDFAKQERVLQDLERASWDLAIIDEAHHCIAGGTTTDDTLRRRLAEVVARRSDGLLLLTATPHDGFDPHFASLIELLDPSLVDGNGGLAGMAYRRHVVRRLKAHLRDPRDGGNLFRERQVIPVRVDVTAPSAAPVRAFHAALSALVAPRLRRAPGQPKDALAFVSLLKRSVSTLAACVATLRAVADRYQAIAAGESEALRKERTRALRAYRRRLLRFGVLDPAAEEDIARLEADNMAADLVDDGMLPALQSLIRLGESALPHDPKLAALLDEVRLIRLAHPAANILVYTEYADSQAVALAALRGASGVVGEILSISGQDDEAARTAAAERCAATDNVVLVSTDALAEGLNLQARCCHLIHLDLPYNPNRLEQRNGRIDRYGQRRDPEIRYLYLAGTFEERLLLRLIAKYEKARASLAVMPDTLGVTADAPHFDTALLAGFAETQATLFGAEESPIRSLDRMAEDAGAEPYRELLHEIDRAYAEYERMAVRHGWLAERGLNADPAALAAAMAAERNGQSTQGQIDLLDFTTAVLAEQPGTTPPEPALLRLPVAWAAGLDGLPGYHGADRSLSVTHDRERGLGADGAPVAFLGRAHPVVRRAVTQARMGDGGADETGADHRVGVALAAAGDRPALLLTYAAELRSALRVEWQHAIAVKLPQDGPAAEMSSASAWLALGAAGREPDAGGTGQDSAGAAVWQRVFAAWAASRRGEADAAACAVMAREAAAFAAAYAARMVRAADDLAAWLQRRAGEICGQPKPNIDDLFGAAPSGSAWQQDLPPLERLAALAADADVPATRRREAHAAIELFQRHTQDRSQRADLGRPMLHPIGLLMLVPPA